MMNHLAQVPEHGGLLDTEQPSVPGALSAPSDSLSRETNKDEYYLFSTSDPNQF